MSTHEAAGIHPPPESEGRPTSRGQQVAYPWLMPAVFSAVVLAGLGALLLATIGMTHTTAMARWPVAVAGVIACGWALGSLSKLVFGPQFRPGMVAAIAWLTVLTVAAVLADLIGFEGPRALPLDTETYVRPDLFSENPLGTDGFGRDYLSRLVYGARTSFFIIVGTLALALTIGTTMGLVAGYFRGRFETVFVIVTDTFLAFPPLILLMAVVIVLQPSLRTIVIATALLYTPTVARLARGNTFRFTEREFVIASKAIGASDARVIVREILPNVARPLFAYTFVLMANLIILEASLSFLGLGIKPPEPSWGNMISDADRVLSDHPHALLVPATALFITVLSISHIGEVLMRRSGREGVI